MDDEFFNRLLETFKIEAQEHMRSISSGLLELEGLPGISTGGAVDLEAASGTVEAVYRQAHSLKGAARAVGLSEVENTCQALESVFSALLDNSIGLSSDDFDLLHESVDTINRIVFSSSEQDTTELQKKLKALSSGATLEERTDTKEVEPEISSDRTLVHEVLVQDQEPTQNDNLESVKPRAVKDPKKTNETFESLLTSSRVGSETIRISVDKLEDLLVKTEELLSVKLAVQQRSSDMGELKESISEWNVRWDEISNFLNGSSLDREMDQNKIKDFLRWNRDLILNLNERFNAIANMATDDSKTMGAMVNDILEDMKTVLMVPCSSLLDILPRVVRDLAKELGKEVDLKIQGGDLEIDRRILEEIKDPLVHLVRNSIDHGIETPEKREALGKPGKGTLSVVISRLGVGKAQISVSDDGAGIDAEKVKKAAQKKGVSTETHGRELAGDETLDLVFRAGVSTSPIVSNISGRGLGLAIVREKVDKLGGALSLETQAGTGTSIRIKAPISLATFRGILVRCSDSIFVIPTTSVAKALRFHRRDIKTEENRDTIEFQSIAVPLIPLAKALELSQTKRSAQDNSELIHAVILRSEDTYCAFVVESIIGEREVLVKGLGKQLLKVRNVSGATILGDGKLAVILNARDLVSSGAGLVKKKTLNLFEEDQLEEIQQILIAEDSITSRMLIKNILENAGYNVTTSVDGAEAWSKLKTDDYDLVVSDVEMPNMNGFELTARIRQDKDLSDLPVILVTGLSSKEDMEKGVDVGANAYIVKSGFEQGDLVDTVKRLI